MFARALFGVPAASLLLCCFAACGGSVALDDVPLDTDAGTAPGANGPGSGNASASGSPGSSGGGPTATGSTSPGNPGSTNPTPGTPTPPPPKPTPIACGNKSCDAATQSCCVTQDGDASCIAKGGACAGLPLNCSSSASCGGGQVCCLDVGQDIGEATCVAKAQCSGNFGPNGGSVILCDTDSECPQGQRCRDAFGAGFKICRARRGGGGGGGPGGPGGGPGGN